MKKYHIILILLLSTLFVSESFAQSAREQKKMEKEAKKALQFKEDSISNENLKILVSARAFVLEANTLFGKSGKSFHINSSTNFVGFDGKNSTIQLAFEQLIGWNGIGGITLDGTISEMDIVDNKKGLGFAIDALVSQKVGAPVTMVFRVSADGSARVDMSGTFGERLTFQGRIVSLQETRVYKGIATY